MWFGLLGPLQVVDAGQEVLVPAAKQRTLLAALLLRSGQALSPAQLAELVWDGAPPPQSAVTLRSYVMRLRQSLGRAAAARIVTGGAGYAIEVAEDEFDITSFNALCRTGDAARRAGQWQRASEELTRAQSLWRGPPLADIPSQMLQAAELPRLEQLHLQATQLRIEADLQLDRFNEIMPELRALTAKQPLHEPFHALLMLALCRTGRQADALGVYHDARRILVTQLGIEPGRELQDLHQRILAGDVPPAAVMTSAAQGVPRELPPPVRPFAGRAAELAALTRLLDYETSASQLKAVRAPAGRLGAAPGTARTLVIATIAGTAGVGKTALALQWAHQVAELFPDGQLYVNLRGYDPGQPVSASEALAGFLRALGLAAQVIPAEAEERAAKYRSLLAGRRVLVLLDNAQSSEQVRPLLPGTKGCAALVTSRDALAGLVARDGAKRLDLDLLPVGDAVELLRALVGARADEDPGATRALAAQCARLPLALRIAAEFLASRPAATVPELIGELADQRRSLDVLDASGDSRTAVRTVFSWSYRQLSAEPARAFRLLGLHPGPDWDQHGAAALLGTTVHQATLMLDQLARAHLFQSAMSGRYSMHDLLRAYASELAVSGLAEPDRRVAVTRLLDYYLHTAAEAMDSLFPAEKHRRPVVPRTAVTTAPFTGPAAAQAWLDAERDNLVAIAAHAAAGCRGYADLLAGTVFRYLDHGGYFHHTAAVYEQARLAAREQGDQAAESAALTGLGTASWRLCHYEVAAAHLRQALRLSRQAGDRAGEARTLGTLGLVVSQQGHYEQAGSYYQQAKMLYQQIGSPEGETSCLGNLGDIDLRLGRYESAASHHEQALKLSRQTGNRACEAYALLNIGVVNLRRGRTECAASFLQQGLGLSRQTGNRACEAHARASLGELALRQGRHREAAKHHEQAVTMFREMGDRSGEAGALIGLGDAILADRQPDLALAEYATALGLAAEIGNMYDKARAVSGLARAYQAVGDPGRARRHWQQALSLFADLGAPEADDARAQLV
jgi:DNA-binding SARP family transcriptional activator/Tfp pilus assembly protein PilF